jgi:tripartite ATP-independent transporter DctP family solute receptor
MTRRGVKFFGWAGVVLGGVIGLTLLFLGCARREAVPASAAGAADTAARKPELVLRFALQPNPANKVWEAASLVRRELEERSGGRIRVQFYDSGVIGDEGALLMNCYLGILELVQVTSSVVTTLDPAFSLLDLPYLFADEAHHQRVLHGAVGRELLDGLRRHRLQGLAFYSCGFRNLFNARGVAVTGPADLRGMKIRVMEAPVMIRAINAMGGSATPLAAGELFQALRTGVVDAAENNATVFVSEKFCEAGARNFSLTEHFGNQHVLVANRDWLERLAREHPDLHAIVREAPARIQAEYTRRWEAGITASLAAITAAGVAINPVPDKGAFVAQVRPVWEDFLRRHPEVDPGLLARIRAEGGGP